LAGHKALVGLLALSPSHLVSADADRILCVWNPDTGELRHRLAGHGNAVTCFQHDETKVISGSAGALKLWDVQDGSFVRDLLSDVTGVWQVAFRGRWCVAASNRAGETMLDIWNFGNGDPEIETDDEDDTNDEV